MKAVIITAAGISSRFNKDIPEADKQLKVIYSEGSKKNTLLYHLLEKSAIADKIILTGGYKFDDLKFYVENVLDSSLARKVKLVYNSRFQDLASGYSFYVGLCEAFKETDLQEILFVEGDLEIDMASFRKVLQAEHTVLTYNHEPICADKSVVLYKDGCGRYHYAFNSGHGLLSINEPFSCILNSGQLWKFVDMNALKEACKIFATTGMEGTNLEIIQEYIQRIPKESVRLAWLDRWINCNTREEYRKIRQYWEEGN